MKLICYKQSVIHFARRIGQQQLNSKLNENDIAILDDGFQDFSAKPNFSFYVSTQNK